ncbi:MAG: hypothetical protein WB777_21295 [Mycobacterium sp.]
MAYSLLLFVLGKHFLLALNRVVAGSVFVGLPAVLIITSLAKGMDTAHRVKCGHAPRKATPHDFSPRPAASRTT